MIYRSCYVNSADSTRFLDIRVARRFPYTAFYRFQRRKTIDSFSFSKSISTESRACKLSPRARQATMNVYTSHLLEGVDKRIENVFSQFSAIRKKMPYIAYKRIFESYENKLRCRGPCTCKKRCSENLDILDVLDECESAIDVYYETPELCTMEHLSVDEIRELEDMTDDEE
jgi:hypothetical protein